MARHVHEIVNPEMFSLRPGESVEDALLGILALRITAAPVLDAEGVPIGVVSLRDLIGEPGAATVRERMTSPAIVVSKDATVEDAARELSDNAVHRLVVVDGAGKAVGVVSALDFVRALLGLPVSHPDPFPHRDAQGVEWTDPAPFHPDEVDRAPDGPGLLILIHGGVARPELPVWAEACPNVRTRLAELTSVPQSDTPQLAHLIDHEHQHLRFRAAAVGDVAIRERALADAQKSVRNAARDNAPR